MTADLEASVLQDPGIMCRPRRTDRGDCNRHPLQSGRREDESATARLALLLEARWTLLDQLRLIETVDDRAKRLARNQ